MAALTHTQAAGEFNEPPTLQAFHDRFGGRDLRGLQPASVSVDKFAKAKASYDTVIAAAELARQKQAEADELARQVAEQQAWLAQQQEISSSLQSSPQPVSVPSQSSGGGSYEDYIRQVFPQYGQDPVAGIRVMYCESGGSADPPHNNVCRGLFQFNPGTWAGTPKGGNSILDGYAQVRAAAWMWSQGRRGEWSCQ